MRAILMNLKETENKSEWKYKQTKQEQKSPILFYKRKAGLDIRWTPFTMHLKVSKIKSD